MTTYTRVAPMLYGALPHHDVADAMQLLQRCPMPMMVWPQLPQRSFRERSVVQSMWGFPGVHVDEQERRMFVRREVAEGALDQLALDFLQRRDMRPVLTPSEAAGLFALLPVMNGFASEIGCKGQMLGPVSLAVQVTDQHQMPLLASAAFFEALVQHLCQRAAWQATLLGRTQRPVMMCIDEPFLDVVNSPFVSIDREELLLALARVLASINGQRALAVRSLTAVAGVVDLTCDAIFVNAHELERNFAEALPLLQRLWQRGGAIGLGCVPSDDMTDPLGQARQLVERLCALCAQHGIPLLQAGPRLYVMPVASLGQVSVAQAEATVLTTCRLAQELDEEVQRSV